MKVGVVGVGVMGVNHARVYSELKYVNELYIYDVDYKRAKSIAEQYNANLCESYEDLLSKVDAVNICVPTQYHYEFAKIAIDKHVNFLVEKPICINFSEAKKLVDLIPDDLIVGVGHIERFNPIVAKIKEVVNHPRYVEINRHNPDSSRVVSSTVVEDLMIHDIDILFNVLFSGDYVMHSCGNSEVASSLIKYSDSTVYLSASKIASKKTRRIYIEEDDKTIEADLMNQEMYIYRKPTTISTKDQHYLQENVIEKILINKVEPLKIELNTFLNSVMSGSPFQVSPKQALLNMEVCEAIKKELVLK